MSINRPISPDQPEHYYVRLCCQAGGFPSDNIAEAAAFAQNYSPLSIKRANNCEEGLDFVTVEFPTLDQANYFAKQVEVCLPQLTIKPKILAWIKNSLTCIWYNREVIIARQLKTRLGGKREVRTPMGRIDLLTETQLIEIKKFRDWRNAIGQVLIYSEFYPSHEKVIYLYDREIPRQLELISSACLKHGIVIKFELDQGWQYTDGKEAK